MFHGDILVHFLPNFLLVICIAKNLIWTTLKGHETPEYIIIISVH